MKKAIISGAVLLSAIITSTCLCFWIISLAKPVRLADQFAVIFILCILAMLIGITASKIIHHINKD